MAHLYVHIPFCTHSCGYCDFAKTNQLSLIDPYLDALESEIQLLKERFAAANQPLKTLYVGGGTPSALNKKALERLLSLLEASFGHPSEEYTVEMNPETVTPEKAALLVKYGVNRVSLGLQAKQPELLTILERRSDYAQGMRAVAMLQSAGIQRLSLDVIYGIPGQTREDLVETLEACIALGADHLSCYALKLEPETPMGALEASGALVMPEDDGVADQLEVIVDYLGQRGFERYEISNFALPGCESRHNLAYWMGVDTLGLGLSAAYLQAGMRYTNTGELNAYFELLRAGKLPIGDQECLDASDLCLELLMLRLRLKVGLNLAEYRSRTGIDLAATKGPEIERLTAAGLVVLDSGWLRLTDAGMAIEHAIILALS